MMPAATPSRENADIESSSDRYAERFAGPVGEWFLQVQSDITLRALSGLRAGASVLDVGGGHAQLTPALLDAGFDVTVAGSDPTCAHRLKPWLGRSSCRYVTADLLSLPYADRRFDAALCYRMVAHSIDWKRLLAELCRVARLRVVIDYPSTRSVNLISDSLFAAKHSMEGGSTRRFLLFSPGEIRGEFERLGFSLAAHTPQFFFPMVLHRALGSSTLSRVLEAPPRLTGMTHWLGSPVIARADRSA